MTTGILTEFLGWASVINIAVLAFTAIVVIVMRGPISRIHSNMFGLDKIAVIVLNIGPYLALKIMA